MDTIALPDFALKPVSSVHAFACVRVRGCFMCTCAHIQSCLSVTEQRDLGDEQLLTADAR